MAILSDYRGEQQATKPPKTFSATLDPSNPHGFLQSTFEFLSKESDFFHNDSSEKELISLARKMIDKHREQLQNKNNIESNNKVHQEQAAAPAQVPSPDPAPVSKEAPLKENKKEEEKHMKEDKKEEEKNVVKEDKKDDEKPKYEDPNKGNGLDLEKYSWVQNLQELTVNVGVPVGTKPSLIVCEIKKNHLKVGIKGQPLIIDGELWRTTKPDDSFWSLEDKKCISILLTKQDQLEWWRCAVKGEPLIDTQKVHPENSKLSDLDLETRSTVEKMMFDQRQKQMGQPSSDEIQKKDLLKQFMSQHPEMVDQFSSPNKSST